MSPILKYTVGLSILGECFCTLFLSVFIKSGELYVSIKYINLDSFTL